MKFSKYLGIKVQRISLYLRILNCEVFFKTRAATEVPFVRRNVIDIAPSIINSILLLKLASIVILGYIAENFQHWIVRLRARLNKGKTPEKVLNITENRIFIVPFDFLSISQTSKYLKIYIWVFAL